MDVYRNERGDRSRHMTRIKQRVVEFLRHYRMDYSDIDLQVYCRVFLDEMHKGLKGERSSLLMLPTFIEGEREIPIGEPVVVLDAGGTHFRSAVVYFNEDKKPVIEDFRKHTMPGVEEEVGKRQFFRVLASYIKKSVNRSSRIGFCFSYPMEMYPNKDGKLVRVSKELKAREVLGEMIGENLSLALRDIGVKDKKHFVLLNDTVATLLAGKSAFKKRIFDTYIGFILGTGTNCCYIEKNSNILKGEGFDPGKSQIINVESGGFGRGPRGVLDMSFDGSTITPGMFTFEKMISGAYLGALCLKVTKTAAEDGLFSETFADKVIHIDTLETKQVSDFLVCANDETNPLLSLRNHGCEEDYAALYFIIERLIERAAKLTTIPLTSVVIKSDRGVNPCFPVCITIEGTTFYGLKSFRTRVERYLADFLVENHERYYEFVHVEHATLIGAAIAGLIN